MVAMATATQTAKAAQLPRSAVGAETVTEPAYAASATTGRTVGYAGAVSVASRLVALAAATSLLALGLTGCAQDASGPREVRITQVEPGQCFTTDEAHTLAYVVDCAEPHLYEATLRTELEGSDFPGMDAIKAKADELCPPQFVTYTGVEEAASTDFRSLAFGPTEQSWSKQNDRGLVCVVSPASGQNTTGSAKAA